MGGFAPGVLYSVFRASDRLRGNLLASASMSANVPTGCPCVRGFSLSRRAHSHDGGPGLCLSSELSRLSGCLIQPPRSVREGSAPDDVVALKHRARRLCLPNREEDLAYCFRVKSMKWCPITSGNLSAVGQPLGPGRAVPPRGRLVPDSVNTITFVGTRMHAGKGRGDAVNDLAGQRCALFFSPGRRRASVLGILFSRCGRDGPGTLARRRPRTKDSQRPPRPLLAEQVVVRRERTC